VHAPSLRQAAHALGTLLPQQRPSRQLAVEHSLLAAQRAPTSFTTAQPPSLLL
jgi:hypothetical protein